MRPRRRHAVPAPSARPNPSDEPAAGWTEEFAPRPDLSPPQAHLLWVDPRAGDYQQHAARALALVDDGFRPRVAYAEGPVVRAGGGWHAQGRAWREGRMTGTPSPRFASGIGFDDDALRRVGLAEYMVRDARAGRMLARLLERLRGVGIELSRREPTIPPQSRLVRPRPNPTVRPPVGEPREVRDLGWLVRHAGAIGWLALDATDEHGARLTAGLADGTVFEEPRADAATLVRWLDRPRLRGLRVRLFGRETTVGSPDYAREADQIAGPLSPRRRRGRTLGARERRARFARRAPDETGLVGYQPFAEFLRYVTNTAPTEAALRAQRVGLAGWMVAGTYRAREARRTWALFVDDMGRAYLAAMDRRLSGSRPGNALSAVDRDFIAGQLAAAFEAEAARRGPAAIVADRGNAE